VHCALTCTIVMLLILVAAIGLLLIYIIPAVVTVLAVSMLMRRYETYQWWEYGLLSGRPGRPHSCKYTREMKKKQWLYERHYEQNGLP